MSYHHLPLRQLGRAEWMTSAVPRIAVRTSATSTCATPRLAKIQRARGLATDRTPERDGRNRVLITVPSARSLAQ